MDLVGDKWTLLIVRDLVSGPRRFVELQRTLPGISTEQLRSRLNRMVADGLLTRQRYREVPPRVDYELTDRARDLIPVLGALARWGYEWSWTEPRRNEAIDVGAIFRLAPGLLTLPRSLRGIVELTVTERSKDGETKQYTLIIRRGAATLEERAEPEADAQVAGTERTWIDALVPEGVTSGLDIRGDARLATAVLEGMTPASSRATAVA
ncbi:MAG TPA: helix-turn-helix domain-containing protein [Conexibacter sp.]|nr:helix-turn-helix domain-containing protein [Conexibacter sp.]